MDGSGGVVYILFGSLGASIAMAIVAFRRPPLRSSPAAKVEDLT